MAAITNFKFVIADPKSGKCYQREVEKKKCAAVIGLKIGDEFDAGVIGLPGYKVQITGGSDDAGFPMFKPVGGPGRKRVLLSKPPAYWPKGRGIRKRKTVRGNTVSEDLVQINTKVIKEGKQAIEEILGIKPKETEAPKEEAKAAASKPAEASAAEAKAA